MAIQSSLVANLLSEIQPRLSLHDDGSLWATAIPVIVEQFTATMDEGVPCFLELGVCSHWLRPHQTRWTAAGGFAWPSGYKGGTGHDLNGLPEFDWSMLFQMISNTFVRVDKFSGKRRFVMRVAVPARTVRHQQAVLHVVCYPEKEVVFFGFRRREERWELVATSERDVDATERHHEGRL